MLIRGVWIVNKVVGLCWCDVPECKVAPAVNSDGVCVYGRGGGGRDTCPTIYTEVLCLTP